MIFDFTNSLITKGITTYGVVGRRMYGTWEQARCFLDGRINSRPIDLTAIVTHELALEEFQTGVELIRSGRCGKVLLIPDLPGWAASF
jgi:threonine 3-dehydrogenase